MKNRQQKNHQGARNPFSLQTGKFISPDGFQKQYSLLWKTESPYGAPGIAARVNCSSILEDASLPIIVFNTLTGLSERSLAVLMMVISTATLFLPRLVMLPKVILRNKTAFLRPCFAGIFVGEIAGYFKNTKSSSLNVIKRLRILSVSWYDRMSG